MSDSLSIDPATDPAADPPVEAVVAEVSTVRVADYVSDRTFADFPISSELLEGLRALNYINATPVQAASIDPALAGLDLLVRAKTGTGKTAAFCVPVIERITAGDRITRALILCPTRELAIQVGQECAAIAKFKDLRIAAIYGGVGFGPQEDALRAGCEIVVGTPGRIMDHMRRGNLKLDQIQFAVLDEADEMLSMGFLEDVRKILDRAPTTRQTFMFSATVNESIKGLIGRFMKNPEEILLSYDGDNVSSVTHILYESSPDYHKARALLDLIEQERPASAIIFCNTREDVNTVCTYLERQGLNVEMISGELPQNKRERVMARVKAGATQFLVATDVAARGIDISDLSHVINYALPEDPAIYTHRTGRTGRIGKTGIAISLAGGLDFSTRLSLERIHKIQFIVKTLPTPEESLSLRTDRIARTLKEAGGSMAYEAWIDVARHIKERPEADTVIAVALRAFFQWDARRRTEALEAEDGPAEARSNDERPRREERRPDDRPRRDEPRRDEPRRDERPRPGDRGPRREESRDARPPRRDEPRRGPGGDRGSDRPRDERPRDDRPRDERPRDERPRDERPRDERPRDERPRDERPRREPRPAPAINAPATEPGFPGEGQDPERTIQGLLPIEDASPLDDADTDEVPGADGAAPTDPARKRRRRRRRRSGAPREGVAASETEAPAEQGGEPPG